LTPPVVDTPARPRSTATLAVLVLIAVVLFSGLCSLGVWQVHRRAWKLDLIASVEQRVHQPIVDAPGQAQWPNVNASHDEYRHVRAAGVFLYDRQTLVQATTDYGSGYWVMTPLRLADGGTVLVNRGFVSPDWRKRADNASGPAGVVQVEGLLRMSEPGGMFRNNDPAANVWYARDTAQIAQARQLDGVAPYFIDAAAAASGGDPAVAPVGGLTVLSFRNSHLSYAITWFALAAMVLVGVYIVGRDEMRTRRAAHRG